MTSHGGDFFQYIARCHSRRCNLHHKRYPHLWTSVSRVFRSCRYCRSHLPSYGGHPCRELLEIDGSRPGDVGERAEIQAVLLCRDPQMPAEGQAHAGGGAKAAVVRNRLQRLGARFQQYARRVDPAALDELGWRYLRVARKYARSSPPPRPDAPRPGLPRDGRVRIAALFRPPTRRRYWAPGKG